MPLAVAMTGVAPAADAARLRSLRADTVLDRALHHFVGLRGGPPGIAVVVHRGQELRLHTAGLADVRSGNPPRLDDHMRLASVAKAFSAAAALSVVADGRLSLDTTIGERLPGLPAAWSQVTLRQLLNHTPGIPTSARPRAS